MDQRNLYFNMKCAVLQNVMPGLLFKCYAFYASLQWLDSKGIVLYSPVLIMILASLLL